MWRTCPAAYYFCWSFIFNKGCRLVDCGVKFCLCTGSRSCSLAGRNHVWFKVYSRYINSWKVTVSIKNAKCRTFFHVSFTLQFLIIGSRKFKSASWETSEIPSFLTITNFHEYKCWSLYISLFFSLGSGTLVHHGNFECGILWQVLQRQDHQAVCRGNLESKTS